VSGENHEEPQTTFNHPVFCYTCLMAILEKFVHFAERLPADRLSSVEMALAEIMESYSERYEFTSSEQQIIDQRVTESSPEFSSGDDIAKLFGKPFSA
jgi:DNA-directed RNA polymerase subunit N (RpoN/RPB10)